MGKWIVTINKTKQSFSNYKEALQVFLKEIAEHLYKHSYISKENELINPSIYTQMGIPDSIEKYFYYRFENRSFTDEEIIIETRLGLLLDYLKSGDPDLIKGNTLKTINKPISFTNKVEDIDLKVNINVDIVDNEYIVNLDARDIDHMYLKTNAFIMDDESKTYYFDTHQIVITHPDKNQLGKSIDLVIKLEKEQYEFDVLIYVQ